MATSAEGEARIVECPECASRMVERPDAHVHAMLRREPTGWVNFGITDDLRSKIYICPSRLFGKYLTQVAL